MRKIHHILIILFFSIAACSDEVDHKTVEKTRLEPAINDQMKMIEKAKGVENVLQNSVEKRRQSLDN